MAPVPDHPQDGSGELERTTAGDVATGGRGGRHVFAIAVPYSWPEAIACRTGARLYREGNDAVWIHIRGGQSLHEDLTPEELAPTVTLGSAIWERWFALGWSRAAELEEG